MINIKSPTGCVHRADGAKTCVGFKTLCRQIAVNICPDPENRAFFHNWKDTSDPVTCKKCLNLIRKRDITTNGVKWVVKKIVSLEIWDSDHQSHVTKDPTDDELDLVQHGSAEFEAEISVVRNDDEFGMNSLGGFGKTKLRIADENDLNSVSDIEYATLQAKTIAAALNAKGLKFRLSVT
jgi:hypothetical protein